MLGYVHLQLTVILRTAVLGDSLSGVRVTGTVGRLVAILACTLIAFLGTWNERRGT